MVYWARAGNDIRKKASKAAAKVGLIVEIHPVMKLE
jgi:hypothetical protein